MSTSSNKGSVTVDRGKALRFISKQEFYKLEATTQDKAQLRELERAWFTSAKDNQGYASQICTYAVQRHVVLLENRITSCPSDPQKMQWVATRDHIRAQTQFCVHTKMSQFFIFVGLQSNPAAARFMQQARRAGANPASPFVMQTPAMHMNPSMRAMHMMQAQHARNGMNGMNGMHGMHPHGHPMQMNPLQAHAAISAMHRAKQAAATNNRAAANNANKANTSGKAKSAAAPVKTKEQLEKEKLKAIKLPESVIVSNGKLQEWLDKKKQSLVEYEALLKHSANSVSVLKNHRVAIKNLRGDIEVLKATVLQDESEGKQNWADNEDLKKIFLDVGKMDQRLPTLRWRSIKPTVLRNEEQFETCDLRGSVDAQCRIKTLLSKNHFTEFAKSYCNAHNAHLMSCDTFHSENNDLNDDLQLLLDFGVRFEVKRLEMDERDSEHDVAIVCQMSVDKKVDGDEDCAMQGVPDNVPCLRIVINEAVYGHCYDAVICGASVGKVVKCMDFQFVLPGAGTFVQKDVEWLHKQKEASLKDIGMLASVVHVYNYYVDAVRNLSNHKQGANI